MLDIELDFPADAGAQLEADIERGMARVEFAIAEETERALRKRATTLWPQRTGFSRDRFTADGDHSGNILVRNTAPYARAVNNRERYPRGGRNPNYRAAQRTITKFWDSIVARAFRKAGF